MSFISIQKGYSKSMGAQKTKHVQYTKIDCLLVHTHYLVNNKNNKINIKNYNIFLALHLDYFIFLCFGIANFHLNNYMYELCT